MALYHPEAGFYATGGAAGRQGDFLTSPEVGPLFGAVVARALDAWWRELGEPDPFVVVEAGAGRGTLARTVLGAQPACAPALRYVLVERSAALRAAQTERLTVEPPLAALGPAVVAQPGEAPEPVPGTGPVVTSLAELPAQRVPAGVVLANELLDNLPFGLRERRDGAWCEVRVGEAGPERPSERGTGPGGPLVEVLVPVPDEEAEAADRLAPDAPEGARIPVQHQAAEWLRQALGLLERGRVVVVDYGTTTAALARRPGTEWVRTYRAHGRGGAPLDDLGHQDVTGEVAVDQLARVRPPAADRSQAEFLRAHGLDELVETARESWTARAAVGDLEALAARSRLGEAEALTDPTGLGAFRVLEWVV